MEQMLIKAKSSTITLTFKKKDKSLVHSNSMKLNLSRPLDAEIRDLKRSLTMRRNILVSGLLAQKLGRDAELKSGLMAVSTKVTGKMVRQQERVGSFTLTVMSTTATGRRIKLMALVFILIWMELRTRVIGAKISSTATVLKHGQMALHMMAHTNLEKSTEKENSLGLMVAHIKEILMTTTSKVTAFTTGVIRESMSANGKTIKWKALESSIGQMVVRTMEHTSTTKKRVMASFAGPMAVSTKVPGLTVNRTAMEFTQQLGENQNKETGRMERE